MLRRSLRSVRQRSSSAKLFRHVRTWSASARPKIFRSSRTISRRPLFALIKQTIEQSFGAPLESLYPEFDETPVGAASIAQVHRAVTTEGRDVAVKVLRPGIEEEFAKAIETYEWAAAHVERYGGEVRRLRPRLVVAQFKQWTARELDLQREAASASELRENMIAEPGYYVPDDRLAPNRPARAHDGMAGRHQAERSRRADRCRSGL